MKTVIPINKCEFEQNGYHFFINAKINDNNVNLLIDTGASKSVFDKERISKYSNRNFKKYKNKSTGINADILDSATSNIDILTVGNCTIKNYNAVFIDLSHVNNSYSSVNLKPIDGILGSDILFKYKAILNFSKQELELTYPKPRQNAKK
ncbi:MAG: hypothetical protein A2X12_03065 [Bacteroidetes bacterium GWE2_29_8]|nr:MAG: hypothetical protein A2X12_03065 [Bacteroidetes bacterium GWE2_29_8]OFY24293.1 MAG: hypothetical protein A2X02_08170 [Bacteroidetes bacterium GWF2_29_10]